LQATEFIRHQLQTDIGRDYDKRPKACQAEIRLNLFRSGDACKLTGERLTLHYSDPGLAGDVPLDLLEVAEVAAQGDQ
jgi:hypothetical protein